MNPEAEQIQHNKHDKYLSEAHQQIRQVVAEYGPLCVIESITSVTDYECSDDRYQQMLENTKLTPIETELFNNTLMAVRTTLNPAEAGESVEYGHLTDIDEVHWPLIIFPWEKQSEE